MNILKILHTIFLLLAGGVFCFGSSVQAALLMHLPLDGNLNDISGNGNNGAFQGVSTNPGFSTAVYNQGLNFDGTNDYITAPSFDPGNTFSTSLWVNHDNIGALNTFIEHANNGNNRNDFYIGYDNSINQLTVELEDNNNFEGGACGNPKFCTGIVLNSNRWYHVVVTVTPTTLNVYIDTTLAYTVTHSTTVSFGNGSWLLGGDTDNNPVTSANNDYLDGRIDDVRIYNHELSQSEISALFGLTGSWNFDDCTIANNATIADSSGNNIDATALGGVSSTTGKICTAGLFDGTSGYVQIPHNALLNGSTALTYSAWINPTSWGGGTHQIMSKSVHDGGSGRAQMGIFSEGGALKGRAETVGGRYDVSIALPSTDSWHHVALVFSGNALTLYVDGSSSSTTFTSTTLNSTTDELNISKRVGSSSQYFFDGAIDEVRVFNRALQTEEITGYYTNPNPLSRTCPSCGGGGSLVAYYELDEASWTGLTGEINDETGNYDGSRVGNAQTVTTGKVCGAGAITANNRAINTTVDVNSNIGGTGTAAFWFRPNWTNTGGERNQGRVLFDASQQISGPDPYFKLAKTNNSGPAGAQRRLAFIFEDGNDTDFQVSTDTNLFQNGQWVYIAVTWDFPNDRFQLYTYNQSGTQIDFVNATRNTNGNIPDLASLYFGENRSGYNPFNQTRNANGTFDEIRIHNQVLTQFEIESFMNATHSCGGLDHFSINYASGAAGTGVNCQAETITIEAHDSNHADLTSYVGTVNLTTNPLSNGDWSKTGTPSDALGTLTPGGSDSGTATYTFIAGDVGSIILNFKDTNTETATLNVADGLITEISNSAIANDDYEIAFASTGFDFLTDGTTNDITLQIGGKPSNIAPNNQALELQAIKTGPTGACESAFQGSTAVEIAVECINPTSCAGNKLFISTDDGTTYDQIDSTPELTYTSITDFNFGNDTDTTAPLIIRYDDVGKIKLHARKILTPSNEQMLGSSNEFVVRPFAFYITASGNPAATGPSGNVFTTAGTAFTTTVTAKLWEDIDDDPIPANYDGIANGHSDTIPTNNVDLSNNADADNYGNEAAPNNAPVPPNSPIEQVLLSSVLNQPSPGNDLGLAGGTAITSFTNGIGNSSSVQHNEVGIIEIHANVNDANYLDIGTIETGKIVGRSGYVGRFTPHHFDTVVTDGCGVSFTYSGWGTNLGQNFTVQTKAMNNLSTPTITQNYDGTSFAKAVTLSTTSAIPGSFNGTENILASDFTTGSYIKTDVAYSFTNKESGPDASFTIRASDTDGISSNDATANEGTTEMRSGRMRIENAFGSELIDMAITAQTEYFDLAANDYAINTSDTCTKIDIKLTDLDATDQLVLGDGNPANSGETCVVDDSNFSVNNPADDFSCLAGDVTHQFSDTPTNGSFNLYLKAPGANKTGDIGLELFLTPTWLQLDNDGDGNPDGDPTSTASFGLYRGDDRIIYWREVFQ